MKTKTLLNGEEPMTGLLMPHGPYWAIYKPAADQILGLMRGTSIAVHMAEVSAREPEARGYGGSGDSKPYEFRDGIAYISMVGPMTKAPTSFDSGCSTVLVRRQMRFALSDPDVKGIVLRIDSPGGSVSGTNDLASDVAMVAKKKPVYGYCEDYCCSAAYWVGSQCTKLYANETALIGSIGTLLVIEDWSKLYENVGVAVHVIATGDYKGAGATGAPLTAEHLADFQRIVDDLNSHFLQGVGRGRGLNSEAVNAIADGRVHLAAEAMRIGLVDAVAAFDDCAADLIQATSPRLGARAETERVVAAMHSNIETVSSEASPHGGMTFAEESDAALGSARGLLARAVDYKATKDKDDRPLSREARAHLDANASEYERIASEMRALLAAPEAASIQQQLRDAVVRAELTAAIQ